MGGRLVSPGAHLPQQSRGLDDKGMIEISAHKRLTTVHKEWENIYAATECPRMGFNYSARPSYSTLQRRGIVDGLEYLRHLLGACVESRRACRGCITNSLLLRPTYTIAADSIFAKFISPVLALLVLLRHLRI